MKLSKPIFKGAATALITPFKDGKIDYPAFKNIIEQQISGGIDALVVCGTTGESATLNDIEHKESVRFVIDCVNGRVPVIAGTGSNDTDYSIQLSKHACADGADALLLVTPYYNKATQQGLIKSFSKIADACDKPVILYNVPSRTGVNIKPETYYELSKHGNIAAIKEANGDISSIAQTMEMCGDSIDLYSGNDDQIVPILSLGGMGVISVLSNVVPKVTHDICEEFFNGNVAKSRELQLSYLELINSLFCEVNPIPVKAATAAMGFCENYLRLPLTPKEKQNEEKQKLSSAPDGGCFNPRYAHILAFGHDVCVVYRRGNERGQ